MVSINNSNNNGIKLSPEDNEFINLVSNRITIYGQIPYNLPERLYVDLIKASARYFYKYFVNSTHRTHIFIARKDLLKNQSAQTGNEISITVKLPQRIRIVEGIYETNMPSGANLAMLEVTTFGGGSTSDGPIGINNNLYLLNKAVQTVEAKVFKSVFRSPIPFDYNPQSNDLYLFRQPKEGSDIVLKVHADLPIENLYNENFFERHVIANAKRELKRILGGHTIELPGGVTMTPDEICNNIEDAEKVEELIKMAGGVGDIIMKR